MGIHGMRIAKALGAIPCHSEGRGPWRKNALWLGTGFWTALTHNTGYFFGTKRAMRLEKQNIVFGWTPTKYIVNLYQHPVYLTKVDAQNRLFSLNGFFTCLRWGNWKTFTPTNPIIAELPKNTYLFIWTFSSHDMRLVCLETILVYKPNPRRSAHLGR